MEKYTERIRIFNHYTNYKGRLFVKTLCDLFNDVAEAQTEQYGVDVATLNARGKTWMLHRLHICLNKMPSQNEEVLIETWPSGIDRLFALRDYRMVREGGEELVRATSEWMYIDLERRRPLRQCEDVVRISTKHHIPHLMMEPVLDQRESLSRTEGSCRFKATFDHIDFNGHVTQASYMRWITNALPFSFLKEHILVEVEVVYEHEVLPDSEIISEYGMQEEGERVVVTHQLREPDQSRRHCIARSVWEKK